MKTPAVANDDRALLQSLADEGPRLTLPDAVRGRLFLYNLITETPRGWVITDAGREALLRPAADEPVAKGTFKVPPSSGHDAPRRRSPNARKSPF